MSAESIKCVWCDSVVELPANFCDMCGIRLTFPVEMETSKREDKKELIIRFLVSAVALGFGIYFLVSTNPLAKMALLCLLPLIIGAIIGSINSDLVNSLQSKVINWCLLKFGDLQYGGGKCRRFFFRSLDRSLTLMISIRDKISTPFIRSGFLFAAFLYICAIMLSIIYAAVSVVVAIF